MNTETLELRLPNGFVNIDRLRELKSLIEKYGDGYAYITKRQSIEIRDIALEDSQNNKLALSLYVNRIRNVVKDPLQCNYFLDLTTEESFKNDQSRVVKRYDGKISDSVDSILKQSTSGSMGIKTSKSVKVDKTLIKYNFIGNNKKPFYVLNTLSKKSVPDGKL